MICQREFEVCIMILFTSALFFVFFSLVLPLMEIIIVCGTVGLGLTWANSSLICWRRRKNLNNMTSFCVYRLFMEENVISYGLMKESRNRLHVFKWINYFMLIQTIVSLCVKLNSPLILNKTNSKITFIGSQLTILPGKLCLMWTATLDI